MEAKNDKTVIIVCGLLILFLVLFSLFHNRSNQNYHSKDIQNYEINEIIPLYITDEQIAKKYLTDYINLMLYYPDKAYELLDIEYKENYSTLNDFKKQIESMKNENFVDSRVREYSYANSNGKKKLYVVDADNNTFIFTENGIMDYTVTIK